MTTSLLDDILASRLGRVRHVALDLDGTIYCGDKLFRESIPFLERLSQLGIGYTFMTNNSSKSRADYTKHLGSLGLPIAPEDIFISSHATIAYLQKHLPDVRKVFALGTAGFQEEFRLAGFQVADMDERPDAVVLGFDLQMDYQAFCKLAYWVSQGLPYLASHPDPTCPTNADTVLVDCGSLIVAIESATGRLPDAVPGKPDPEMLRALARRLAMDLDELAMVGDRLLTDVQMALRAGSLAVLTLTGATQRDHLLSSPIQPDLIITHLGEFADLIAASR